MNVEIKNRNLVSSRVKFPTLLVGIILSFFVSMDVDYAQTIDINMNCDSQTVIPVVNVDGTGHNIFELGTIKIQYDGLFGRWLIFQNGTMVFFQNSLSSPNPPSNLSWTAFGNNGCSGVTLFDLMLLPEICNNGIDDDGDSFVDCLDMDCAAYSICPDSDHDGVFGVNDLDFDNDGIPNSIELFSNGVFIQPICDGNTSLDFTNTPVLISGIDLGVGSEYRVSNVSAGMDALITIVDLNNCSIATIDDNSSDISMFKPSVYYDFSLDGDEGFVELNMKFVFAGTSAPKQINRLMVNFNDIDGEWNFWEKNSMLSPHSYTVDSPSELTMVHDGLWLEGTSTDVSNVGSGHELSTINFNTSHNHISEITFRLGAIADADGVGNIERNHSVEFECVSNYINPYTYEFDFDRDGIINAYDLDSDNDGIYDVEEVGLHIHDVDGDGRVDGNVGANGLLNAIEIVPESGIVNYTLPDTDVDGNADLIDLDSDGDGCNDVNEAGFPDANLDGVLGGIPLSVDVSGKVIYTP